MSGHKNFAGAKLPARGVPIPMATLLAIMRQVFFPLRYGDVTATIAIVLASNSRFSAVRRCR